MNEATTICCALDDIKKAMEYYRKRPPIPITLDTDFMSKKVYPEIEHAEELLKQYESEYETLVKQHENQPVY